MKTLCVKTHQSIKILKSNSANPKIDFIMIYKAPSLLGSDSLTKL